MKNVASHALHLLTLPVMIGGVVLLTGCDPNPGADYQKQNQILMEELDAISRERDELRERLGEPSDTQRMRQRAGFHMISESSFEETATANMETWQKVAEDQEREIADLSLHNQRLTAALSTKEAQLEQAEQAQIKIAQDQARNLAHIDKLKENNQRLYQSVLTLEKRLDHMRLKLSEIQQDNPTMMHNSAYENQHDHQQPINTQQESQPDPRRHQHPKPRVIWDDETSAAPARSSNQTSAHTQQDTRPYNNVTHHGEPESQSQTGSTPLYKDPARQKRMMAQARMIQGRSIEAMPAQQRFAISDDDPALKNMDDLIKFDQTMTAPLNPDTNLSIGLRNEGERDGARGAWGYVGLTVKY